MPASKEVGISTINPEYILLGPCYHLMVNAETLKISQERTTFVSKKVRNHSLKKKKNTRSVKVYSIVSSFLS
jgi:hypothetical protein